MYGLKHKPVCVVYLFEVGATICAGIMKNHIKDIIYLSRNYRELQSSGAIVLGLFLLSEGIRMIVWEAGDQLILLYYTSLFALLGLVYHGLRSYYDNSFGRLESSPQSKKYWIMQILWYVTFIVAAILDNLYEPFVILHIAEFSLFFLWIAISDHYRRYYLLPGGLIMFFAFSPLWFGTVEGNRFAAFGESPEYIWIWMGIVFLLMGVLDHLSLKRVFNSLQDQAQSNG